MINDNPQKIQPVFDTVKAGFRKGTTKDLAFRKQQLKNLLKGLEELNSKFEEALRKDLGYSKFVSFLNSSAITVGEVKDVLNHFEKWAQPKNKDTPLLVGPGKSYIVPEPFGVVLVIGAWNYPIYTCIPYVATAIAAGNAVILKPSEMSPNTSNVMNELFEKYLDKNYYQCVEGEIEVAKKICTFPFDLIVFTGSPQKGKLIAKAAAENLTPTILELGGKSPTIVDEGADLENASKRIIQGRFMNAGQTCVACDYILVHKNIKQQLLAKLKEKVIEFYGQDASKSEDYAKIINEFHSKRLQDMINEKHGGSIIVGGKVDVKNRFVEPTIIDSPKLDSQMMQEEIFGPILPVIEFNDFDWVINYINDRPKPLVLYYYGPIFNNPHKKRLEVETSSGAISFNESCFHILNPELPFGGVQQSGSSAVHGDQGFYNMSHMKPILDKLTINSYPFSARFPPYTQHKQKVMRTLFTLLDGVNQNKLLTKLVVLGAFGLFLYLLSNGLLNQNSTLSQAVNTIKKTFVKSDL